MAVLCRMLWHNLVPAAKDPAPLSSIRNRLVALSLIALLLGASVEAQSTPSTSTFEEGRFLAPAEGGIRRWTVAVPEGIDLAPSPAEGAATSTRLPMDTILSNFGCAAVADQIWCEVRPLHSGSRGFVRADGLLPGRGPDGITAIGPDDSDRRARKGDFDDTTMVPCAQEVGEDLGTCTAEAARSGGGDATIVVTFANGFARKLYFTHGAFISANATMSGSGRDTDWSLRDGTHLLRVDDQRYEVPAKLILGN